MNNMQKMRDSNSRIRKALVSLGFSDIVLFPHSRFFKDVWHLFDGCCKKCVEASPIFDVYWIQAKTGYAPVEQKNAIEEFCFLSGQKAIVAEVVHDSSIRKNGKKVRLSFYGR